MHTGLAFAGYAVALAAAIVIAGAWSGLRKYKELSQQQRRVLFGALFSGCVVSAVSLGTTGHMGLAYSRSVRFAELCTTAQVVLFEPASNVDGVLIEGDGFFPIYSGSRGQRSIYFLHLQQALLQRPEIRYIEVASSAPVPRHFRQTVLTRSVDGRAGPRVDQQTIESPTARYVVRSGLATNERDRDLGILGSTLTVADRERGRTIADARFFWRIDGENFCPVTDRGQLIPSDIVWLALGLGTPAERDQYRSRLPK